MLSDSAFNESVKITVTGGTVLSGRLNMPEDTKAIIIFAHGSGSSHHSPRNNFVAEVMQQEKFATLLIDLLTPEENENAAQFDTDDLAQRLLDLRSWIDQNPYTEAMYTGVIATSSAAAAALQAVVRSRESEGSISSVVCRGGKPDEVMPILNKVHVPVLFLVGSKDQEGIESNRKAIEQLPDNCELKIIEGAGHSFEEEGKLEEFAINARDWFLKTI